MVAGYCGAACAALGMAAASSLTELAIAAAAYGGARALAGPAANALPPRIVAAEDLLAANALLGAAASAGQVAGPLAASAALALSGFPAAFIADAASYLIGAAVVAPLPLRPGPASPAPGLAARLSEGIRLVIHHRAVRLVIAVSAAVTFTSASFLVVEPLYARHVLHRPPSQFALFEAAAGTGAILAGLVVSRLRARLTGGDPDDQRHRVRPGRMPVHRYHLGASRLYRRLLVGAAGTVFGAVAVTTLQRVAPCKRTAGSWASAPPFNPGSRPSVFCSAG